MTRDLLPDAEIQAWLAEHPAWLREGDALIGTFRRGSFAGAVDLVVRIAAAAQRADHHPDIDIRWDTVRLVLTTHSSGGITEFDLALAGQIDALSAGS